MTSINALFFTLIIVAISTSAIAQLPIPEKKVLVVLDSEYILPTGHELSLNQFISLENERELDLQLPDGTTAVLKGPANGRVDSLLKGKSRIKIWSSELMATLLRKTNDSHVMVTRGNGSEELWRPNSIPIPFSGNFCTQNTTNLSFFRAGNADSHLNIKIKNNNEVTELRFPSGNDIEISWPQDLSTTGQFELEHSAWFGEYKFTVIKLQSMKVESLARASCSYQLKNFKRFMSP